MRMNIDEAAIVNDYNKSPFPNAIRTERNGFVEWQVEINTLDDLFKLYEECNKINPDFFSGLILNKTDIHNKTGEKEWFITIFNYYLD